MNWKLKLLWMVVLGAWLMTTNAQSIKQQNSSPRLLIIRDYFSGVLGEDTKHTYDVLRAFLVNYSDDTLKYWGTACRPTEFFNVTKNDYMHLADADCKDSVFKQISIPPHRSQPIPLSLLIDKQPRDNVNLTISMKFYRWFKTDDFEKDKISHQPILLRDKITLRFDTAGNRYQPIDEWKENERKEKMNLPTKSLHLLTIEEKKHYTITIDQNKIFKRTNKEYPYSEKDFFILPVTVHNDSNDTLKYSSMTCSWQAFYRIDNEAFEILSTDCDKNIPTRIIVPPHSTHATNIAFILKNNTQANSLLFKVGLNINTSGSFMLYDEELYRYNIVWSNEVQFIPK